MFYTLTLLKLNSSDSIINCSIKLVLLKIYVKVLQPYFALIRAKVK